MYSPKEVIREARNMGLLSDEQLVLALQMIEDRNKSTHLCGEAMAAEVYNRVRKYADFMEQAGGCVNK